MAALHEHSQNRLVNRATLDPSDIIPIEQTALLISVWTGTGVATVFTILRSWLQFRHNKRWFVNDYLLGVALALHLALSITITCMAPSLYRGLDGIADAGPGANDATAVEYMRSNFLKYQFAALIQLWTTLWMGKMAMLSFYWRLFNAVKTKARFLWWIIFSLTIATWIVSIILQTVACDPPTQPFSPSVFIKPRSIAGFNRAFHFAAISDIVTDITIILVPLPLLRVLRLTGSQKAVLLFIFLTPIFAIFIAVMNLVFESIKTLGPTINPIRLLMHSTLEISLFIIVACLPSLRLYFKDRRISSSNSKETTLNRRIEGTPQLSIDWGSMVLRPIMSAGSRPGSQPISLDHFFASGSREFQTVGTVNENHEMIGRAV